MGKLEQWTVPPTWDQPIKSWTTYLRAAGRRPATISTRVHHIRSMARDLNCPINDVDADQMIEWFGSRIWKPVTRNSYHSSVTGFWGYHYRNDPDSDPSLLLKRATQADGIPRPAPTQLIVETLRNATERTAFLIRLMAEYGLRREEAVQVALWDLLNEPDGWLLLVHGKGGKDRLIPLDKDFAAELTRYAQKIGSKGWIFPGQINGHLSPAWAAKLVRRELGGPWTSHTLRHRFGTTGYRNHPDLLALADVMGHARTVTTQLYVRLSPSSRVDIVAGARLPLTEDDLTRKHHHDQ